MMRQILKAPRTHKKQEVFDPRNNKEVYTTFDPRKYSEYVHNFLRRSYPVWTFRLIIGMERSAFLQNAYCVRFQDLLDADQKLPRFWVQHQTSHKESGRPQVFSCEPVFTWGKEGALIESNQGPISTSSEKSDFVIVEDCGHVLGHSDIISPILHLTGWILSRWRAVPESADINSKNIHTCGFDPIIPN